FIIDSLEEIKRILNNGITTDVHDLKLWREQHQRDNETHTTDWKQILFPVVSQIITSVITIIAILAALHIPPFK
ncbi:MAG: hypothetical protein V1754_07875, partial [Pseudomonadota bacterium]